MSTHVFRRYARYVGWIGILLMLWGCAAPPPAAPPATTAPAPTAQSSSELPPIPPATADTAPRPPTPPADQVATRFEPGYIISDVGVLRHNSTDGISRELARVAEGALAATPAVAPGGRQLAFVAIFPPSAGNRPTSKLYLLTAGSSELRTLWEPEQGVIGGLAWSIDGTALYVGIDGLRAADAALGGARLQEIVMINVADGALQPLIEDALDPAVSPDGTLLAYIRAADSATEERAPVADLELLNLQTGEVRSLIGELVFEGLAAPRFAPDGSGLIIAAAGGPTASPRRGLAAALAALFTPPSVAAHGDATYEIWAVDLNGAAPRRLTDIAADDPVAVFLPDGRAILIRAAAGLYRLELDSGSLEQIGPGGHGGIDWAEK